MPGRILIGLDTPKHGAVVAELGIRWAQRSGAVLVGLGIVDEPGIRAIEPAWPVGGTPGVDPVYYIGYEARLAAVHRQVGQLLEQFAARCAQVGVAHAEVKVVGSPDELIAAEAQSCDLVVLARGSHFHFTARDHDSDEILRK
ncbi:MAG TPA: universal stress protein, partial [Isosphaeraceae bacterium]|nr:universal stress protein [Isosphaeraceae bacterium]